MQLIFEGPEGHLQMGKRLWPQLQKFVQMKPKLEMKKIHWKIEVNGD